MSFKGWRLAAALIVAYVLGIYGGRHYFFPAPQIHALRTYFFPSRTPPSRYTFDDKERLVFDEQKSAVPCPKQTERTAVLLILGQSNAANHGGQRFRSRHQAQVVNYFDGQCFIAESPLLGSSGTKGEYWTQVANLLIESGRFDSVVLAPVAFSGSQISRWSRGGDLNDVLVKTASELRQSGYKVTDVLWVQGEIDYVIGTSERDYRERFQSLLSTLRREDILAPVYVSTASLCLEPSNGGTKTHILDNPIARAQFSLSHSENNVYPGVNTDALLAKEDRYDDCHIGGSGMDKVSKAWVKLLLSDDLEVKPWAPPVMAKP